MLERRSNYPKELFDPEGYSVQMFFDSLKRAEHRQQLEKQVRLESSLCVLHICLYVRGFLGCV